ncbi:MAG: CBS domain-containing protein [Aquabacterium sp.]|nr:CBS domain-containing protein [Aquabacterium sp.]
MTEKLTAGDLCNRIVAFATRDMTVEQAAQLMREHHVGCLVVADDAPEGRLVVGMLTDRDIVTGAVALSLDPARLSVENLMTAEVITAGEGDSMEDLLTRMRRKGLRRLPVTTPQGVLVGLVTLDDLLAVMAGQLKALAAAIEIEQLRERQLRP